ncbi:MAG TPA: M13 family metallopeptidase [Terriglobales bacterium]|jgi:putative endopeptidase|nr:M13 family metallopeptidase [Terriglobales bacterium]
MATRIFCVFSLLLSALLCSGQTGTASSGVPKEIPAFDLNAIDKSIDPCVDFYQYACGTWMKNNPIPADKSRWGRFDELAEHNLYILRDILNQAQSPGNHSAAETMVGAYYASCMDESAIEKKGIAPLTPELERIDAIKTKADLIREVASMHRNATPALFAFYPQPDMHDSTETIAFIDQGGITLPDRDYYIKDDPKSVETRQKYVEHVEKMFELAGDKQEVAAAEAKTVLAIETGLAQASMDRTARRDPKSRDHKTTVTEIAAADANFDLTLYFADNGSPKFTSLNVGNPDFFKQVNEQLHTVALDDWKVYLRWKTINTYAPGLTRAFVEEDFLFNGKYMSGQQEIEPRWKRCVKSTDASLGMALGKLYVDRTFGAEGKERTLKMVQGIESAMREDISQLPWMTETTKNKAYEKLSTIVNNIGYPDQWRDYSSVAIKQDDYAGNVMRAGAFEVARQYKKIDQPTDRKDWGMTPPTVNAYYRPPMNDINFPAGILQPPFYGKLMDDAVNYGGIGVVIGHELTHGFDDQGRKYDAKGNFRDWWTAEDGAEFEKRVDCTAKEYSSFVSVKDDKGEVKLNGRLTLGENTADNGGLKLAYIALMKMIGDTPVKPIDGYTARQRFFLAYGQIWCQNVTDQEARKRVLTDPHSPGQWRVNGAVQNSEAFQQAFGCKAGQPMVAENACRVW